MNNKRNKFLLSNLTNIAKGIAKTFGEDCEVVIHDTTNLENSVVVIENGYVTGRKVGSPMTDLGLYFLQSDLFKDTDFVANYQTESKDGRKLKSTTIFIRDNKNKIIAFLCINYDLENLINIKKKLDDFCINISTNVNQIKSGEDKEETFTDSLDELLEKVFTKAQKKIGKKIENMQKDEKLEMVRYLQKRGVFLVKGTIEKVANLLNVSRYTIYNYLVEVKSQKDKKIT